MSEKQPSQDSGSIWNKPAPAPPASSLLESGESENPGAGGAGSGIPWLAFAGVVLLALGSALLGHIRSGQLLERTDKLAGEVALLRNERQQLQDQLAEQKDRRRKKLAQHQQQLARRLAVVQGEQEKNSQLGVDLLAKLLGIETQLKQLRRADTDGARRMAGLEKAAGSHLRRADLDRQAADVKRRVGALRKELAAASKASAALAEGLGKQLKQLTSSVAGKADSHALSGLARKRDLDDLARKKELTTLADKQDLVGLVNRRELKRYATKNDLVGLVNQKAIKKLETTLRVLAKGIQHMLETQQGMQRKLEQLEKDVAALKKK